MKKEFVYKDWTFKINVELYTKIEKTIGGRRWHTVTIDALPPNRYHDEQEIEWTYRAQFMNNLLVMESLAKKWVDSSDPVVEPVVELLLSMGFTE